MAEKPLDKIDITPLVGVALILVIIFVVTSPLILAPVDMEIDLPKAATLKAKSEIKITISLAQDGELALNEDRIATRDLEELLRQEVAEDENRLIVIRADRSTQHKKILSLLSLTKRAGARNIALATRQRTR